MADNPIGEDTYLKNSLTVLQDWLENKIEELEQGTDEDVYQNSCCIQTEIHTLKKVLGKINEMEI